ncbi:hypothetical protein ACFL6N_06840 [Thermodesulfobacteriota bacterium]
MIRILLPFILSFVLLLPAVQAEESAEMVKIPRLFGTFTPKIGDWSQYTVFEKDTGRHSTMKMAIVGKEKERFWYEVVNEEQGVRNIVKMLITGDPNDSENIQRLILKSGNNPAQEMPREFVMMGRRMASHMFERRSGVPASPSVDLKLEKIGHGSVTVPAGTFEVTQNRIIDTSGKAYGTYNFSSKVFPFGVVSSESVNTTLELIAYGSDAKSMINEEPIVMNRPPGMPEGMPRGYPPGMLRRGRPPK